MSEGDSLHIVRFERTFAEGMAEGRRRLREGASHSVWAYLDYEPQTAYENGIRQAGFAWLNQRHGPSDSIRMLRRTPV